MVQDFVLLNLEIGLLLLRPEVLEFHLELPHHERKQGIFVVDLVDPVDLLLGDLEVLQQLNDLQFGLVKYLFVLNFEQALQALHFPI